MSILNIVLFQNTVNCFAIIYLLFQLTVLKPENNLDANFHISDSISFVSDRQDTLPLISFENDSLQVKWIQHKNRILYLLFKTENIEVLCFENNTNFYNVDNTAYRFGEIAMFKNHLLIKRIYFLPFANADEPKGRLTYYSTINDTLYTASYLVLPSDPSIIITEPVTYDQLMAVINYYKNLNIKEIHDWQVNDIKFHKRKLFILDYLIWISDLESEKAQTLERINSGNKKG